MTGGGLSWKTIGLIVMVARRAFNTNRWVFLGSRMGSVSAPLLCYVGWIELDTYIVPVNLPLIGRKCISTNVKKER